MFTKSSLTEHPVRVKIATRAQTEQFALLSEQHWTPVPPFFDFPPVRPAEASLRAGNCHGPARCFGALPVTHP